MKRNECNKCSKIEHLCEIILRKFGESFNLIEEKLCAMEMEMKINGQKCCAKQRLCNLALMKADYDVVQLKVSHK